MFKMKCILLDVLCCVSVFVFRANCEWVSYPYLKNFSFLPILGECYVMYDESEIMSPFYCQRPANLERQSCIELLAGEEKHCLGLKTPANETIEFLCKDTKEEILTYNSYFDRSSCFRVYSANNTSETICPEIFEDEAVEIRTPANFIILLTAKRCPTSTSAVEREAFSNFVNNFSFDSEIRSCFKVYNPDQVISPHTCLNKDIQESCIGKLPEYEGCFGIITPNNETVILDCPQGNQISDAQNCFKIYTSDNVEHTACKEAVEERCVGVTTPSNLTVLLECYYCYAITHNSYSYTSILKYYDPEDQRPYRKLLKTYIDDEYLEKNSYLDKIEFKVFSKHEYAIPPKCYKRRPGAYAYWLPNTSCYGITLESNETLVLECTLYEKHNTPGCFKIISSDKERNDTACIRVLDERCVGIRTPQNLTVAFACYPEYNCYENDPNYDHAWYAGTERKYQFHRMLNTCYEIYNSSQEVVDGYSCLKKAHPEKYSCIDWIPGQKPCLGLKVSKNETIEFACGDTIEEVLSYQFPIKSCFPIYDSNRNVTDVACIEKMGNVSIGITTSNNLSILFDSFYCSTNKSVSKIEEYKEFVENFHLDPNMKSCYKVYAPHQEISPFTCFSREADDACVSVLDNSECMGISTRNNETIILNCDNNVGRNNEPGCFEIYTADNEVHIACQEKLEESCVGITTPSKLRVLFDCHTCIYEDKRYELHATDIALYRSFQRNIKNSLETFKEGNYTIENRYYVYKPGEQIDVNDFCFTITIYAAVSRHHNPFGYYHVHVLHGHNNCLGITLDNLETIVLECPNEKSKRTGCFDVYSPTYGDDNTIAGPEQKVQKVCVKSLNHRCLGIITPGNRTLPLYCLPWRYCSFSAGGLSANSPNNKPPLRI